MVTIQNLKTTHGVGEEVTGLRSDVQNVGDGVEGANNKSDVILHGASCFYSIIDTLLIGFRLPHFQYRLY
jgi:hypothetical protein